MKPPTRIAGIELERVLGQGGMGTVFLGRDVRLDRMVAVKLMRPDLCQDPVHRDRFLAEARQAARLHHPHLVTLHLLDEEEGQLFFVMEYAAQGSLKDRIQDRGRLTWQETLSGALHLSDCLAYAHREGCIHGDVKPANVLIRASGDLVLADFGLARQLSMKDPRWLTPGYCGPDRLVSGRDSQKRDDLYGLGAILYECLTGSPLHGEHRPCHLWPDPGVVTQEILRLGPGGYSDLADLAQTCSRLLIPQEEAASLREAQEAHEAFSQLQRSSASRLSRETRPMVEDSPAPRGRKLMALACLIWILAGIRVFWTEAKHVPKGSGPPATSTESFSGPESVKMIPELDRALELSERGLLAEAVVAAENAVRENPKSARAQYSLGLLLAKTGRDEEALEPFRQALAQVKTFRRVCWKDQGPGVACVISQVGAQQAWLWTEPDTRKSLLEWREESTGRILKDEPFVPGRDIVHRSEPAGSAVVWTSDEELWGMLPEAGWKRAFKGRNVQALWHSGDKVWVSLSGQGMIVLDAWTGRSVALVPDPTPPLMPQEDPVWDHANQVFPFQVRLKDCMVFAHPDGQLLGVAVEDLSPTPVERARTTWQWDLGDAAACLWPGESLLLVSNQSGQIAGIQTTKEKSAGQDPTEPEILLAMGSSSQRSGRLDEAQKLLKVLVEDVEPCSPEGHLALARTYRDLGLQGPSVTSGLLAVRNAFPGQETWQEACDVLIEQKVFSATLSLEPWEGASASCVRMSDSEIWVSCSNAVWRVDDSHRLVSLALPIQHVPAPITRILPGERLIVASGLGDEGQVSAVSIQEDQDLWTLKIQGDVQGLFNVSPTLVLAEVVNKRQYGKMVWIDPSNGQIQAERSLAGRGCVLASATKGEARIIVGADVKDPGLLRAYETQEGSQVWNLDLSPARVISLKGFPEIGALCALVRGEEQVSLMLILASTGSVRWSAPGTFSPLRSAVLCGDRDSVWVSSDRSVTGFDMETGKRRSFLQLPSPAVAGISSPGQLMILTRRGELLWKEMMP